MGGLFANVLRLSFLPAVGLAVLMFLALADPVARHAVP